MNGSPHIKLKWKNSRESFPFCNVSFSRIFSPVPLLLPLFFTIRGVAVSQALLKSIPPVTDDLVCELGTIQSQAELLPSSIFVPNDSRCFDSIRKDGIITHSILGCLIYCHLKILLVGSCQHCFIIKIMVTLN